MIYIVEKMYERVMIGRGRTNVRKQSSQIRVNTHCLSIRRNGVHERHCKEVVWSIFLLNSKLEQISDK